jgi:hypothetical protein
MNYSDEQIEEGLRNFFIQVEVKTQKGADLIYRISLKLNKEKPYKVKNVTFVYGYIFEGNKFGLNGSYSKKENITVISI